MPGSEACFHATVLAQIHRSTFLPFQEASHTPSFGGFGIRQIRLLISRLPDYPTFAGC